MLMELPRAASRPWWYDYRYWRAISANWPFKLPRARGGAGACEVCGVSVAGAILLLLALDYSVVNSNKLIWLGLQTMA